MSIETRVNYDSTINTHRSECLLALLARRKRNNSCKEAQLRWMYVEGGNKNLLCSECRKNEYRERQQYEGYHSSNELRRLEDYTREDYRRNPELFES